MKELHTACGTVLVDDEDYERVSKFKWAAAGSAAGSNKRPARSLRVNGKTRTIYLYRDILGTPPGVEIDHVNGNPLDNRRANLRVATRCQQMWNRPRKRTSRAPYKGVTWSGRARKWMAQIDSKDRGYGYLGLHATAEAAAVAYDAAALERFGEFAAINGILPAHRRLAARCLLAEEEAAEARKMERVA